VGHLNRQSRNTSGTHTSTHTCTNTHTNTYKHTYKHTNKHIHAHMHTYKHIHAAIRNNGREGLVFPVLGWVGHLVIIYNTYYYAYDAPQIGYL